MKKIFAVLLALSLTLLLCGCSEPEPSMYIEPAQLTEEETAIAELMDANMEQRIFDFQVDDTVQQMDIRAYELIDGDWQIFFGGGGSAFTDAEGRMALDFDKLEEGLREAIQSEHTSGSTSIKREPSEENANMSWTTSLLSERVEIVYGTEVPLAIQIVTSKNEIRSFDTSYFFCPEEYEKYGYEHVYAVTVLFSQEPLS